MKIALFSDTFFPQINGVVNVVHHVAESLSHRGHEVCVFIVSGETAAAIEKKHSMPYRVVVISSLPVPMYPGERFALPNRRSFLKVKEFKPDIIHTHTPFMMGREALLCARRLKVPLVGTHHTFYDHYLKLWHLDYPWARFLSWKITNRYYNQCAVLVSPTHALADTMKKYGLRTPVEIIPNPVALSNFKPYEKRRNKKDMTVVYMGRLSREKDIDKVLEAYAQMIADGHGARNKNNIRLVIIGDGPYKKELERIAMNLGICDHVTFTGFLRGRELAEELRAHDVFVTASASENMPVSVLEAMASGLPVVAVSALGMPEIVQQGINGFLVPPGDTEAMASRVWEIIHDRTLRERFSAASRELALLHDPDHIAARHEELYKKLLSK